MRLYTEIMSLIKTFSGQANTLTIPAPYVAYTESLECALLLSQCVYWSDCKGGEISEWPKDLQIRAIAGGAQ